MRHLHSPRMSRATRDFIAELIGTFMLVYIGQAAYTSFELTGTQSSETTARLAATITCYGVAFLFASFLTLTVSGAHLNPAYTLALACYGHFKWRRVPAFLMAQYSGAFVAACFVHATYNDKIGQRHAEGLLNGMNVTMRAHGNLLSTGKFFTSYPPIDVSLTQMFISHTIATAMLALLLLAIVDSKCARMPRFFQSIFMCMALVCVLAAFSANGGPCLNPAADFSPRLYASISGWGGSAFNLFHYTYWWICGIVAPHFGALLGVGAYQIIDLLHEDHRRAQIYDSAGVECKSLRKQLSNTGGSRTGTATTTIATSISTIPSAPANPVCTQTTHRHGPPPHYQDSHHAASLAHVTHDNNSNNNTTTANDTLDHFSVCHSNNCRFSMRDSCCSSPLVINDDEDDDLENQLDINMDMR